MINFAVACVHTTKAFTQKAWKLSVLPAHRREWMPFIYTFLLIREERNRHVWTTPDENWMRTRLFFQPRFQQLEVDVNLWVFYSVGTTVACYLNYKNGSVRDWVSGTLLCTERFMFFVLKCSFCFARLKFRGKFCSRWKL